MQSVVTYRHQLQYDTPDSTLVLQGEINDIHNQYNVIVIRAGTVLVKLLQLSKQTVRYVYIIILEINNDNFLYNHSTLDHK